MENLYDDIRYGLRGLKSNPTFAFIAILTLAMGIGITTAMFTLVNNVLLQPLPFPNAEELVYPGTINMKKGEVNASASIENFEAMAQAESPLAEMAYYAFDQATLARGDQQLPLTVMITSANYLSLFGVQPAIGRWYEQTDVNRQAVLISHRVWEQEFNNDPGMLSKVIKLNNQDFQVLGVMPPDYSNTGYTSVDLWMPINQLDRPVQMVARLKPGLSISQAEQQSEALQRLVNQWAGDAEDVWQIHYTSVLENMVGDARPSLYLLLASVGAVFLIAVLNVVNLTFAQYSNRTQELAVRVSVGASRKRLLRQLLTESTLLCTIGGLLGLLMAAWTLEWVRELMGTRLPRLHEIGIDQTTVLAVLGLISLSALLTTLIPAFSIVNPNKLAAAIKEAGRKVTGDAKSQRIRRWLVGGEVCVAVVLLICAGLLMRSYVQLANQETGFNPTNIVTGHIWLPDNFQPQPNRSSYWLQVVDTLAAQPNVQKVAATSTMPMSRTGIDFTVTYSYAGAPAVARGEEPAAAIRSISPGYFDLLEIPLLAGRTFDARDTAESPKVTIINKALAEAAWPDEDPVGNVLELPDWVSGPRTVIGVVDDVKHRGLKAVPKAEFFLPVTQHAYPGMSFLVKTSAQEIGAVKNQMLRTATTIEATAPMILVETLEALTRSSIAAEKLLLTVLGAFAGIALLLASIGVYGVSDNMVSQRTNEIGIRMALGARPGLIRRWIMQDTAKPVFIGAGLGLGLALIASQLIASVLYGVQTTDPLTFVSVPLVLLLVGILATWVPARRATRIHPQQALHYE